MTHATPLAPRRDHTWTRPTGQVQDPYAWLIDKSDPDTLEYLRRGGCVSAARAAVGQALQVLERVDVEVHGG